MIRTLIALTAFAAIAGAANAAEIKVSILGKDDVTVRTELGHAAKLACQDVAPSDYAPCVTETYHQALYDAAKIKTAR
jgi:predicted porin